MEARHPSLRMEAIMKLPQTLLSPEVLQRWRDFLVGAKQTEDETHTARPCKYKLQQNPATRLLKFCQIKKKLSLTPPTPGRKKKSVLSLKRTINIIFFKKKTANIQSCVLFEWVKAKQGGDVFVCLWNSLQLKLGQHL